MECLESLRGVTYPDFKIFVVDNGSSRDDVLHLRNWQSGGTLIENDTNLGFSGGNNVGIRRALASPDAAYVLILNNDTIVEPAFLSEMIATAQGHPADMVSPKILDYGDRKTVDRLGIIITRALRGYDMKLWEGRQPFCPSGCCALYSRRLLDDIAVKGEYFDEDFFAYAEDVDLGIRAVLRGYQAALSPRAVVYHKGSASTSIRSPFALYHGHRNTLWYLAKSVPASTLLRNLPWVVAGQLLPLVSNAIRGHFRLLVKAKMDGLRGMARMLAKRKLILGSGNPDADLLEKRLDPRPFYLFPRTKRRTAPASPRPSPSSGVHPSPPQRPEGS